MLGFMHSSRLAAVALLGLGVAISFACTGKQQNGMECLKSTDCESSSCINQVCVDPNASKGAFDAGPIVDTGATDGATDGASDVASETSTDSGPEDTGATSIDAADAD
jgi:hypothetical protein